MFNLGHTYQIKQLILENLKNHYPVDSTLYKQEYYYIHSGMQYIDNIIRLTPWEWQHLIGLWEIVLWSVNNSLIFLW